MAIQQTITPIDNSVYIERPIASDNEINEILENGLFNVFFVLGRTIGFIGHWYDQRRLKQGLFRLNKKDIKYLT